MITSTKDPRIVVPPFVESDLTNKFVLCAVNSDDRTYYLSTAMKTTSEVALFGHLTGVTDICEWHRRLLENEKTRYSNTWYESRQRSLCSSIISVHANFSRTYDKIITYICDDASEANAIIREFLRGSS